MSTTCSCYSRTATPSNRDGTDTCKRCLGPLVWYDKLITGWNGAPSDQGTDHMIACCEDCGRPAE